MYSNSEISEAIKLMAAGKNPSDSALAAIVSSPDFDGELSSLADRKRREVYSDEVYLRGLIEISSYCRNNCYYCGLRVGNANALRYRLSKDEILEVCNKGYGLGFRTFVLQGGEDPSFTDSFICDVISSIKKLYPDCAVTLSIGERDYSSYKAFFDAGADRYLLRHETADEKHYRMLHPESMSLQKRKECLFALKEIGYQVGSGFMVGSPYQTVDNIVADLRFLQQLSPDMIGIGPFVSHWSTPFKDFENGSALLTVRLVSVLRLLFPHSLIPATTSLATIGEEYRKKALISGANVIMPNLTPLKVRKKYELYNRKLSSSLESAQAVEQIKAMLADIGYRAASSRGDVKRPDN